MRLRSALVAVLSATALILFVANQSGATGYSGTAGDAQLPNDNAGVPIAQFGRSPTDLLARGLPQRINQSAAIKGSFSRAAFAPGGEIAFVSNYYNGDVYILNLQGILTATLSGFSGPNDMSVDNNGNLYVANSNTNTILILAPPYNGPPTVLHSGLPGQVPIDPCVDSHGNVALTGAQGGGASPTVQFFAKGQTYPSNSITSKTFGDIFYCAFDANGDLYVDGDSPNGTTLGGEIVGGINGTAITPLTTTNQIPIAGGIQVTKFGDIAIMDSVNAEIDVYSPPVKGSLGSPVAYTTLSGTILPGAFALNAQNTAVIIVGVVYGYNQQPLGYSYPVAGKPLVLGGNSTFNYLPRGSYLGAAINPTAKFPSSQGNVFAI